MSMRLAKFLAPVILFFASGSVSAQHHGGGGHSGGHVSGGHISGGSYHGGYYGGYHSGYRGGYYGGYRGYGYGYGGYGYPFVGGYGLGYGLGGYGLGNYGLGYSGLGGYGGYRYSSPYYYGGYSYPYAVPTYDNNYFMPPTVNGNGVVQASGVENSVPSLSADSGNAAPAVVTVMVPDGAQVWFDGKESTDTGNSRVFTSPMLQPGQPTMLTVKARWDGSNREMQLPIRAGDKMSVDLRRD